MTNTDDPFADLEIDLDDEPSESSTDTQIPEQKGSSDDSQSAQYVSDYPSRKLSEPAFSFHTTKQDALYARPESWDRFDDILLEVELTLRSHNIRDVPKRELHDAALRVLADHGDELVDVIISTRCKEP